MLPAPSKTDETNANVENGASVEKSTLIENTEPTPTICEVDVIDSHFVDSVDVLLHAAILRPPGWESDRDGHTIFTRPPDTTLEVVMLNM
jgi:hypothetical protein